MRIEVVMPAFNRLDLTRGVVPMLREQGGYDRFTIYDNGSTDGTREWLDEIGQPWVDASTWNIHNMWNDGIDRALEQGTDCAIVILNNDIALDGKPDWLKRLCDPLTRTFQAVCPHWDARCPVGGVVPVETGVTGWAFAIRGDFAATYRFPTVLHFWYGDTDMNYTMRRDKIPHGVVLDVACTHVNGGSQSWDEKEMAPLLRQDREWFHDKWQKSA